MLVLSRKEGQAVSLGNNVEVFVVAIRGDKVRLGFKAPTDLPVHRSEIADLIRSSGQSLPNLIRELKHPERWDNQA